MPHDRIGPTQKKSCLSCITLIATIIAFLSFPVIVSIAPGPSGEYVRSFWIIVVLIVSAVIFFFPFSIAFSYTRNWRLWFGIYLTALSILLISLISYTWDTNLNKENIFCSLTAWILCCISGLLHIMVWWKEREHRIQDNTKA